MRLTLSVNALYEECLTEFGTGPTRDVRVLRSAVTRTGVDKGPNTGLNA
jgi:hypothetical protein